MSEPVSIIIRVYNYERFLEESLESVLNQTYSDIEFI
ncbi:MAG: glycosyltransferase [Nitrosopumilus sp.]